jgi:hypothetical protein
VKYLMLLYGNEAVDAKLSEAEMNALISEYFAYDDQLKAAKALIAGEALKPVSTATTVRVRSGKALHTDGPFAETKEQLGGFYLIDVPDLEKALEWAAKCPASRSGSVEVRPLMEFTQG